MKKMKELVTKLSRNNEKNQPFSDCYLQTVNPWAISEKLQKDNPDMPLKVAKAMTFSIISNEYTRIVINEEHKDQEKNIENLVNLNTIPSSRIDVSFSRIEDIETCCS